MGLNSESVIKIVDLLCEGPIDAIEGAKKGIFLNLQNKSYSLFAHLALS